MNNNPYQYTKQELIEAALNPIIIHLIQNKPFNNEANDIYTISWINYAKISGLYEKIKNKYPLPFQRIENIKKSVNLSK